MDGSNGINDLDKELILNTDVSDWIELSLWEFLFASLFAKLYVICDDKYIADIRDIEFNFDKKQCYIPFDCDGEKMYSFIGIRSRILVYNTYSGIKTEVIIKDWFNAKYFHMNTLYKIFLIYAMNRTAEAKFEYQSMLFCILRANVNPDIQAFADSWRKLRRRDINKYEYGGAVKMTIYSNWFDIVGEINEQN